jgi:flagellum-specific peptidoglycan hydrolase FlgJ
VGDGAAGVAKPRGRTGRRCNRQHAANPARAISTLPDGRQRVDIDDQFADYDSLDASCQDYAWLITEGDPYSQAWRQYQRDRILAELIGAVARIYGTAPAYAALAEKIVAQSNVLAAIVRANTATTAKGQVNSK